jgi:hypothetical protein
MSRALVVFESMFGNTQAVAAAIADGLATWVPVDVVEVGTAPAVLPGDIGLLVVGAPTHAFGMSRASTRADAARQASGTVVSGEIGLREWLGAVRAGASHVPAAAFDTRIHKPRVPGSAARAAARRLRRLGFGVTTPPESFYVTGATGPLMPDEVDRARRWGEELGAALATAGRLHHTAG